jgi:hypothetical protein
MHLPAVIVGNDKTGAWAEAGGLSSTEELVKIIDSVSRGDTAVLQE